MIEHTPSSAKAKADVDPIEDDEDQQSSARFSAKLSEFLRRYSPSPPASEPDLLQDRYRVDMSIPLMQYDGMQAVAYAATDLMEPSKQLVAYVCKPESFQRHHVIEIAKNLDHPSILQLCAAGPVNLSLLDEQRFVVFYAR